MTISSFCPVVLRSLTAAVLFTAAVFFSVAQPARAQVEEFTCGANHFDSDDGCDCGCAVADPDCGTAPADRRLCEFAHCASGQVPTAADPALCEPDVCGNGYVGDDEVCDDGDTTDEGGCFADCTGVVGGFLCGDEGQGCRRERCGDGVRTLSERCDDGNETNGDGCDELCVDEPGFICFDNFPCRQTFCGDFFVEIDFTSKSGESCDDGNSTSGDGCDPTCEAEPGFFCDPFGAGCFAVECGNGIVEGDPFAGLGESCDDQNDVAGDGCDNCVAEPGFTCFNGPCHRVRCGDSIVDNDGFQSFEQCDDGDALGNDGCSAACALEQGFDCFSVPVGTDCIEIVCGDGVQSFDQFGIFEACDDGNDDSGDGCDGECRFVEAGFICEAPGELCREPVCGDGQRDGDGFQFFEECDDSNTNNGDGCSAVCTAESGFECPEEGEACVPLPPGWTCALAFFDTSDGCDCGCGALDPDCESDNANACNFNHCFDDPNDALDPCDPTQCVTEEEAEEPRCDLPGEGEGESGEGEGEGDGDDDDTPPTCANASSSSSALVGLVLLLRSLKLRRGARPRDPNRGDRPRAAC